VEISVEPTLTCTLFENDVTSLLLRESSLQTPSVTDEFEQIHVEKEQKAFGKMRKLKKYVDSLACNRKN